eukprot:3664730-Pyramimonas_sp.AAC.1
MGLNCPGRSPQGFRLITCFSPRATTSLSLMGELKFIDDDELLTELLSLIGEGTGSVEQLHRLARGIMRNCRGVPKHISDIASIAD